MTTRRLQRFSMAVTIVMLAAVAAAGENRFDQEARFGKIDAAVRSLGSSASIEQLARRIDALADGDWERVRAAFVWVAHNIAYDTNAYFGGARARTSAEGVLSSGRSVCQGYAVLFAAILGELGIEAHVVSGYAKGYGYRPGTTFRSTNHAWNAVRIAGQWHLFDTTWAAGHMSGRQFVRESDDYWFDPDPELFVYTHLPADARWQFTGQAISKAEFERSGEPQPHTLASLWNLGFTHGQLLHALRSGVGLPQSYSIDNSVVRVLAVPLRGRIHAHELVEVRLYVPAGYDGAIINNGSWTHLQRDGDYLVGMVRPNAGSLKVSLRLDPGRRSYRTVLEYRVS